MNRVEGKLQGLSLPTLQAIIRECAKQTPSNRRWVCLSDLEPPRDMFIDAEGLLAEIDDLRERVESGSLCTGWGWDHEIHEERDFGQKPFIKKNVKRKT